MVARGACFTVTCVSLCRDNHTKECPSLDQDEVISRLPPPHTLDCCLLADIDCSPGVTMAVWWWALEAATRRGITGDVTQIEVRWNTRYNYSPLLCNTAVPPGQARSPTQCDINTRSQCRTSPPLLLCNKMNWHNTWCFTPPSPPQPVMKMVVQFSLSLKLREDARVLWSGMDNSIFNYRTPPPFSPISNALLKTISGIIRAIYLSDDYTNLTCSIPIRVMCRDSTEWPDGLGNIQT